MADYSELNLLFAELDELHRLHMPSVLKKPDGQTRESEYISELIDDDDVFLLIALSNDTPVGLAHVSIQQSKPIPILVPRKYGYLETIVVASNYRRMGVGKRLLHQAEQWATSKEVSKIQLGVSEFNLSAARFYEDAGYEVFSRRMWKDLMDVESD